MIRFLIFATLTALLGWCIWWWIASSGQRAAWDALIAQQRSAGRTVEAEVSVSGFPSRVDSTLTDIAITDPVGGWAWRAPFFQVLMLSYRPNHAIAVWPPDQTFTTAAGDIRVQSELIRASAVVEPGLDLTLTRTGFEIDALALSGLIEGGIAKMQGGAALAESGDGRTYDLRATAQGPIRLALPRGDLTFDTLLAQGAMRLTHPLDRHVATGRTPRFDRAAVESVVLTRGADEIRIKGDLAAGARGRLEGTLNVSLSAPELLREVLEAAGVSQRLDPLAMIALQGLLSANGPLSLDLIFAQGRTLLGPLGLPIGPAPKIR